VNLRLAPPPGRRPDRLQRRRADCYDNAPMESFFHTLKTELVHHQRYATREEARRDISRHSTLPLLGVLALRKFPLASIQLDELHAGQDGILPSKLTIASNLSVG